MAAADGAREPLAARAVLRTSDANEAQHVVAGAYVSHRLRSSDALDARLNLVASARMTFGYLTYGATVELDVPPMVDWYHINLTLRGSTGVRHAGVDVRTSAGRSGVVLSPVGESVLR